MYHQITFNDIPTVLGEMQSQLDEMKRLLKDLILESSRPIEDDTLVFGIFRRKELIRMSDKRLYTLPTSPFKSYDAVARAKRNGCPFTRPSGQRTYVIKSTDLEKWFSEWGKTEIPEI